MIVDGRLRGRGRARGEEDGREIGRRDLGLERAHELDRDVRSVASEIVGQDDAPKRGHVGDEDGRAVPGSAGDISRRRAA